MNGGRYAAMERFRGRSDELGFLQRIYDSEGMRTCAVLGRRRIGKSFILEKFCSQRRSVYVEFVDSSESTNVELLDAAMAPLTGGMSGVRSFKEALNVLRDICFAEKTVVVFDEFPYLTQNCKSASSLLQNFIDTCIVQSKSMFVICGSSITVMRDETSKTSIGSHLLDGHAKGVCSLSIPCKFPIAPCCSEAPCPSSTRVPAPV